MSNEVFLKAFHELLIMAPIGFVLDMLVAGPIVRKVFGLVFSKKEEK